MLIIFDSADSVLRANETLRAYEGPFESGNLGCINTAMFSDHGIRGFSLGV